MNRGWLTVVCAATGPSFSEQQAVDIAHAQYRGTCKVIAINDNWRLLPTADVLYAGDGLWFDVHLQAIRASGFAGELWTQNTRAMPGYVPWAGPPPGPPALRGFHYIKGCGKPGLTTQPNVIHNGRNSGFAAINLAYLFGARRIILVGYDMQRAKGKMHWFGDHPKTLSNDLPFEVCIKHFGVLAGDLERAGVEVINATEQTALRCFKQMPLAEAL
jgi:hypothetical protein